MTTKPTCPFACLSARTLPEMVVKMSEECHLPVLDKAKLFFRGGAGSWHVPTLTFSHSTLDYEVYYCWQGDGSLSVFAYLYFEASECCQGKAIGMLWLGTVAPADWQVGS